MPFDSAIGPASDLAAIRRDLEAATAAGAPDPKTVARLATTCASLGDWTAAEAHWRELLRLRPGAAVALTGLGIALRESGHPEEALETFATASRIHPREPAVHFNLGTCLLGCDRPKEAVGALRAALALDPSYTDARFNLALALMKGGSFRTGALAYESRWQAQSKGEERPFTGPRWDGRTLPPNQTLLLWGEQGIGDEIMFAGLIDTARKAAAGPVFVECAPRLVPLLARSFPGIQARPRTSPPCPELVGEHIHCPTGSLPGLLWPERPEAPAPYLRTDPAKTANLQAWLASLGPGKKIGIAWRGGVSADKRPRTIPPTAWPMLRLPSRDIVTVCLQHGTVPDEIEQLEKELGERVHCAPGINPLLDLDAFAALIAGLDGVVAVDNSTIHLAGAIGVPTAVLLGPESDWRWGIDGIPCPWYRTVQRIRYSDSLGWGASLRQAARFLETLPKRP